MAGIIHREHFPVGSSPDSIQWDVWNAPHVLDDGVGGLLAFGPIADGEFLVRDGDEIVGGTPAGGGSVSSAGGIAYGADLLTGDNSTFESSLGDWTASGGTLTRVDNGSPYAPEFSPSTHWMQLAPDAENQYMEVPVAGTFLAGHRYAVGALVREVANRPKATGLMVKFGLIGTDAFEEETEKSWGLAGAEKSDEFWAGGVWAPTATRTGVTLRLQDMASNDPDFAIWRVIYVFVAEVIASRPILGSLNARMGTRGRIIAQQGLGGTEKMALASPSTLMLQGDELRLEAEVGNVNFSDDADISLPGPNSSIIIEAEIEAGSFVLEGQLMHPRRPSTQNSDQEVTDTTLVNTEMSAPLAVSEWYGFRFVCFLLNDGATEGVRVALHGEGGLTVGSLKAQVSIYDDTLNTLAGFGRITALDQAVGAALSAGANHVIIEGAILSDAAGLFRLQFAQNAAGANAGVHMEEDSILILESVP